MAFRFFALALLLALWAWAQTRNKYPPEIAGARVEFYKSAGDAELRMWIIEPEGHKPSDRRPAIVFFFGGGWRGGYPDQFARQSEHFASRGMVAMMADYRVAQRHGAKAKDCVEDARSAIRWVRANAARLGVDSNRVAAGGGSAGGHLAAALGTLSNFDAPGEDTSIPVRPNALVLFNPAVVLAPFDGGDFMTAGLARVSDSAGLPSVDLSPYHHLSPGVPPTIIFHGKADTTVPYQTVEAFTAKMKELGNRCELVGFDKAAHGFFSYGRGDGSAYEETVRRADEFLVSLGFLDE